MKVGDYKVISPFQTVDNPHVEVLPGPKAGEHVTKKPVGCGRRNHAVVTHTRYLVAATSGGLAPACRLATSLSVQMSHSQKFGVIREVSSAFAHQRTFVTQT